MMLHVILEPEEDGLIVAECPALPGCVSQGKDEQEAVKAFEKNGRVYRGQVGSHMALTKTGMVVNLSIPNHKELKTGTLRKLIRGSHPAHRKTYDTRPFITHQGHVRYHPW